MRPLALTLKGFRGVRAGLGLDQLTLDFERLADGAELIAIAGANGSGKTTIMDNLTPFTTLPSRAATAGPGSFSYYDHVYRLESEKDLTWAHEGRRYRSQLIIRLNGRRRTEAFLHVLDAHGRWQPMRLDDGTVSDGKVETYTRCVEAICGSADTFFTSVFSAQGKRQLSTYRNAEIKTLLADLLGQEEIRALGQKAAETVRLLKAGLWAIQQEQGGIDEEAQRVDAERQRLDGATARMASTAGAKQAAQSALDAAQARHAQLAAEREQSRSTEVRRTQLVAERKSMLDSGSQTVRALEAQDHGECQRLERLDQRVAARIQQERTRRQALEQTRRRCADVLAEADTVRRAAMRLPLAQRLLRLREARTHARREQGRALTQCQGVERLAEQKLANIERDAGKAVFAAEELAHRFGLTGEVPCAGTDLQGRCKLLGDAREAQVLIPNAKIQVTRLAIEKAQARATLAGIERELASLGQCAAAVADIETADERTERQQIAVSRRAIAEQIERQARLSSAALARLDDALVALPAPYDEQQLATAVRALIGAREALAAAERSQLAATRDAQALEDLSKQVAALIARRKHVNARSAQVENELANWNLFARCISNDGLIALAIDDAGPALSALANDLLLACYGPRFTVSIHTLLETGNGEPKEGFDIVVHDGETGESKSLGLMSGGERSWVEACLTRAIALYLAQHTGRRYTTLFSDEADGALDPQRKRMFMAMKREVLRLGGYEREFFVSQTPELTAMADAVIDLDVLAMTREDVV